MRVVWRAGEGRGVKMNVYAGKQLFAPHPSSANLVYHENGAYDVYRFLGWNP